jgi:hypothetical protein
MENNFGKKIGESFKGVGNFIKENPKPLLYVGGGLIAVVAIIAVAKKIKSKINGEEIKGGSWNEQEIDETKTSINDSTAKNYTENLFEAFNYTWGTDKGTIEVVFSKINSEDFKKIYNFFGKRSYSSLNGGTPSGKVYGIDTWIGSQNLDLVQWLNKELGFGDSSLKRKIRPIIESAGFVLEK